MIQKAGIEYAEILSKMGAETLIDSHKNSAPEHEMNTYVTEKYNLQAIKDELVNPDNIYHIIKHDNEIAGFSKMILNTNHREVAIENVTKMDQLYLLNSFHGLKLGAKLLQFNIELSKANNQNGMWLVVWIGNLQAIAFYEKFGFKTVAFDKFRLSDTHLNPCQIMFLKY